jgi:hypothetical protein
VFNLCFFSPLFYLIPSLFNLSLNPLISSLSVSLSLSHSLALSLCPISQIVLIRELIQKRTSDSLDRAAQMLSDHLGSAQFDRLLRTQLQLKRPARHVGTYLDGSDHCSITSEYFTLSSHFSPHHVGMCLDGEQSRYHP